MRRLNELKPQRQVLLLLELLALGVRRLLTLLPLEAKVLVQPIQRPVEPGRLRGRQTGEDQDQEYRQHEPQHAAIVAPSGITSSPGQKPTGSRATGPEAPWVPGGAP